MSLVSAFAPPVPTASLRGVRRAGRTLLLAAVLLGALSGPQPARAAPPPISFADIVDRVAPAVVNIATTKAMAAGQNPPFPFPRAAARLAVRGLLPRVLRAQPARAGPAAPVLARLGLRGRPGRLRRHQQSRDRRGRRDPGRVRRRDDLLGQAGRPRPEDRSGGAQDRGRQAVPGGHLRRQRPHPGRRLDHRDRQSLRPRQHRDRRHHLGPLARHPRRTLRRFPAGRRADQSRQLGRPDLQSRGRGDRDQHRDLLAERRQRRRSALRSRPTSPCR